MEETGQARQTVYIGRYHVSKLKITVTEYNGILKTVFVLQHKSQFTQQFEERVGLDAKFSVSIFFVFKSEFIWPTNQSSFTLIYMSQHVSRGRANNKNVHIYINSAYMYVVGYRIIKVNKP